MGVSRQCAHRWVARYDAEGEAGLMDRSSRPHRCRLGPAPTSSARCSRRASTPRPGLARPRARCAGADGEPDPAPPPGPARCAECDPLTGAVIRASKTTAVRYERAHPGELVHMDVKKIGRIPDGGGWRAHGRQMGSTSVKKKARIGFDYVHSVVDDHSRFAYSEILPDETGRDAAPPSSPGPSTGSPTHGIDRIERVMTDNHWSYTRSSDARRAPRPAQGTATSSSGRTAHGRTARSDRGVGGEVGGWVGVRSRGGTGPTRRWPCRGRGRRARR